jgi:hypothetical protein
MPELNDPKVHQPVLDGHDTGVEIVGHVQNFR